MKNKMNVKRARRNITHQAERGSERTRRENGKSESFFLVFTEIVERNVYDNRVKVCALVVVN